MILTFSWMKEKETDMHLIYRTVQICLGGGLAPATKFLTATTAVFSLGKPCLVKNLKISLESSDGASVVSGRTMVCPTVPIPYRDLIEKNWQNPEVLYRALTLDTLNPAKIPAEHWLVKGFDYSGVAKPSFAFDVPIDQIGVFLGYSVVLTSEGQLRINDIYGEVEVESCHKLFADITLPSLDVLHWLAPGALLDYGIAVTNAGKCLGDGVFMRPDGQEVDLWLAPGETKEYKITLNIMAVVAEAKARLTQSLPTHLPERDKLVPTFEYPDVFKGGSRTEGQG